MPILKKSMLGIIIGLSLVTCCHSPKTSFKATDIDWVSAAFPVNFSLYTTTLNQYVAYYDTAFNMTIAMRPLNSNHWQYQKLNSKVSWDSHNYLSLMVDSLEYIHLVGNMHSSPLIYFKSNEPGNIQSMQLMDKMVGTEEDTTTYPEFLADENGRIIFHYRYGRSGNGYEVYNYFNVESQTWHRLLDVPLLDGQGLMNAYAQGPTLGQDGYYHMIWVWRDTWDCSTNHTLSYARSKNLTDWESIRGEQVNLPLTIRQNELVVDATPSKGGLINIGIKLGFGSNNEPLIGYHKYDSAGNTQLFISRFQDNKWHSFQVTNWNYRWDFKGMGTIKNELLIEAPFIEDKHTIVFGYHHTKYGNGQVLVNEHDFSVKGVRDFHSSYPGEIDSLNSNFPEMVVQKVFDKGIALGSKKFMLRWETLPPNRDGEINGKIPGNSMLQLLEY